MNIFQVTTNTAWGPCVCPKNLPNETHSKIPLQADSNFLAHEYIM